MKPEECPKCGGKIWMVEYSYGSPHRYDGVSEYACENNDYRIGRWCGKELSHQEVEPRFCEGTEPHPFYESNTTS